VYVALTNECNAELTMLAANGPAFTFPPGTSFEALPSGREPTGKEAAEHALQECGRLNEMEGERQGGREVVFAGLGEPLLRLPALLEALHVLKQQSEVCAIRLNTNGLVPAMDATSVVESLKLAGLTSVCVQLQTASPSQHRELVQPKNGLDFSDACNFVSTLAKLGVLVECTAVARPGVDLEAVHSLAVDQLGANLFKARPYFP